MTRSEILDQAKKCVCGDRDQQYGNPENNFQLIADLWNDYLCCHENLYRCDDQVEQLYHPVYALVTAEDVAAMMVLFKTARIRTGVGTDDSFVDICGYAACGGEIHNPPKKEDEEHNKWD